MEAIIGCSKPCASLRLDLEPATWKTITDVERATARWVHTVDILKVVVDAPVTS